MYKLSLQLSDEERRAIVDIEGLPPRLKDQGSFDVLMQLERLGRCSKPDDVAKIFKNIDRIDLAKKVSAFKFPKKSKKRECTQLYRGDPDKNVESVLQVTKLQYNILMNEIQHLWEAANRAGYRRIEEVADDLRSSVSEHIKRKLPYISGLLATAKAETSLSPSSSISSTSSSGEDTHEVNPLESEIQAVSKQLKSHSLPRDLPGSAHQMSKQPMIPPPPKNKPSCSAVQCTEDPVSKFGAIKPMAVTSQPPTLGEQVHKRAKSQLSEKKTSTKPAPPPKPRVKPKTCVLPGKQTDFNACKLFKCQTISLTHTHTHTAPLQTPIVDVKPNRSKADQPVNDREVPATIDDDDDDDYSELTFTGDSGFADSRQFIKPELRREPPAQPLTQQPAMYTELSRSTIEPVAYYKTSHKEIKAIRGEIYIYLFVSIDISVHLSVCHTKLEHLVQYGNNYCVVVYSLQVMLCIIILVG